jgi:tRNA1Val (adenine37-N6)-methyltransferase
MLAQRSPTSFITGVEIDEAACLQASENMANSPWWNRLRAVNASIQDFSKSTVITFDLIVSNPPFFSGGTFSHTQSKNSVRHTVKLPHGDLLYAVKNLLGTNGRFCTVLPNIEGLRFKELAANYGLFCSRLTEVYSAKGKPVERLLMCFERAVKPIERNKLSIQSESGQLSDEYVRLTEDFYLNL